MTDSEIISAVKKTYPEFVFSEEGILLNLNKLTLQFVKRIESVHEQSEVDAFFNLINSFNSTDNSMLIKMEVGVLEILTDTKKAQDLSFIFLKNDLLARYAKLFDHKFWRL